MNDITKNLLEIVSDWNGDFKGAYNIRENGMCAGRQSSEHIKIENKTDKPGMDIKILPGTKGESVSIPACDPVCGSLNSKWSLPYRRNELLYG